MYFTLAKHNTQTIIREKKSYNRYGEEKDGHNLYY